MKITIIGAGNMGGAIAKGLTAGSLIAASDITVTDINAAILAELKAFNPHLHTSTDNPEAVKGADIVLIAVKPWLIDRVAAQITPAIDPARQIIISIVAGVPFEHLNQLFSQNEVAPMLYRVIPNTAIAIRESMTAVAACNTSPEQDRFILSLFDELGQSILIEERLMGAATALGSCGTAFALRYIRASVEAGVEMGLYPAQAQKIAAQTVKGAAQLLLEYNSHPEAEIDKVTTPGGITIKGLNEMEHAGFSSAVIRGLKACL